MPCSDGYPPGSRIIVDTSRADLNARVACEALKRLELLNELHGLSVETTAWWRAHKAEDARREAAERAEIERNEIARTALLKLSPNERRALGLR